MEKAGLSTTCMLTALQWALTFWSGLQSCLEAAATSEPGSLERIPLITSLKTTAFPLVVPQTKSTEGQKQSSGDNQFFTCN